MYVCGTKKYCWVFCFHIQKSYTTDSPGVEEADNSLFVISQQTPGQLHQTAGLNWIVSS